MQRVLKLAPVFVLLLLATAVVADTTFYGSNVFYLESVEVPTTVTIQKGSSADTNTTIQVFGVNGADVSWARWDGTTLRLSQYENPSTTGSLGVSLTPNRSLYYFILLLAPFLLLGFDPKKLVLFAVLLGVAYMNVQAQGGSYSVVITIPSGMTMDTLSIVNQDGDVTGNDFNARNFFVMLGQNRTGSAGRLSLTNVGVMMMGNIQTASDVQLSNIVPLSNALQLRIAPGVPESSKIQLQSYFGLFNVIQSGNFNTTFTGSHCVWTRSSAAGSNSSASGSCTPYSRSNLVVDTTNSESGTLNLDFGPATCTASWVDPVLDQQDIPTPNPTISTEMSSQTYNYNTRNLWSYREQYGSNINITQLGTNEFAAVIPSGTWRTGTFWFICDECLPALKSGLPYNLDFSFKTSAGLTVKSIKPGFLINPSYRRYYQLNPATYTNETTKWLAIGSELVTSSNGTVLPNYASFSTKLTPNADMYSGVWRWNREYSWETTPAQNLNPFYVALAFRIQLTQDLGTRNATYSMKDVTLTQPAFTYAVPQQFVDAKTEYFTPRKPALELDPNPRGQECAWTQTGVKQWHDPATWGGSVPTPGKAVTIPANTKVVVGACINGNYPSSAAATSAANPMIYPKITIPAGSALIFADAVINIFVQDILVQGNLSIGTQNCRVFSPMSITFTGRNTGTDTIGTSMGSKGIGVEGTLDIHAKQYHFSWTRLSATANAGDDRVYLQDSVNWEVGQEVAISTTFYQDHWWDQNEIRTIRAIDYDNKVVQFTEPLSYYHYAGEEYQAEIGLLSRRVLLQGFPNDSISSGFGGHVQVRGGGTGRFSGVQATAMGQTNLLARYPYHFHLLYENGSNSFIRDSSCKNTLYRCITVHGTYNVEISRNFGYKAIGHSFYMEDGVEENNTFSYNLAMNTQIIGTPAAGEFQGGITVNQGAGLTQPADISAAGFYITNAMNTYIGNAASGGWTGYAFPNLFIPINEHQTWNMDPSARPLKLFDGNTAHSAGYYWGSGCCIYVGGNLKNEGLGGPLTYLSGRIARNTRWPIIPTDTLSPTGSGLGGWTSTSPKAFMKFQNSKVFLCQKGINHWGNTIELTNYESHDNTLAATTFGQAWMGNALINGRSGNKLSGTPDHRGFQFYDTYVQSILTDVTFKNFQHIPSIDPSTPRVSEIDNFCLISMIHSDKFKPQGISSTNRIRFVNVERSQTIGHYITDTGASRYYNFIDTDGSFTYSNGPQVVGAGNSGWWIINDNCRFEWNVYICPKSTGSEIGNINIMVPNEMSSVEPPAYTSLHMGTVSLWGDNLNSKYPNRTTIFTNQPGVTGITGKGWYWYFNKNNDTTSGLAPLSFSINTQLIPNGTFIMFATSYPAGTKFNITTDYTWARTGDANLTMASSLDQVRNGKGNDFYYFDGAYLYLKLVNNGPLPNPEAFTRGGAKVYVTSQGFNYFIQASGCTATNGYCFANFRIPTATFTPA